LCLIVVFRLFFRKITRPGIHNVGGVSCFHRSLRRANGMPYSACLVSSSSRNSGRSALSVVKCDEKAMSATETPKEVVYCNHCDCKSATFRRLLQLWTRSRTGHRSTT
jgi:hypothetical protein